MLENKKTKFTPVNFKGHLMQDDFEMNEDFGIIILGSDGKTPTEENIIKPRLRDRGDSFLVGELGD